MNCISRCCQIESFCTSWYVYSLLFTFFIAYIKYTSLIEQPEFIYLCVCIHHMCIYVCVCKSMCVHGMCTDMCTCTCVHNVHAMHVCLCVAVCMQVCVLARVWILCICVCAQICVCIYVYMYIHMCMYLYVSECMCVYTHIRVYTDLYVCVCGGGVWSEPPPRSRKRSIIANTLEDSLLLSLVYITPYSPARGNGYSDLVFFVLEPHRSGILHCVLFCVTSFAYDFSCKIHTYCFI